MARRLVDRLKDDAEVDRTAILNVILICCDAGNNILEEDRPAGKLWSMTLRYIQSCPGLQYIYWGKVFEKENVFLFLIQWESIKAWRSFQSSLGVSLLMGLFAANPMNWATKLELSELIDADQIVEVVVFGFQH